MWGSAPAYLRRWTAFYEKWEGKKNFSQPKFLIEGKKSFATAEDCKAYQFLNQIIVATEKPKEDTTGPERKFRKVEDSEIDSQADLAYADLHARNLRKRNLKYADLEGSNLLRVNLFGADLRGANLMGADLRGADLTKADLTEADLWGADLRGANFTEANLTEANFTEANLTGADLTGAEFIKAEIIRAKNWRTAIFNEGVLEKLEIMNQQLKSKSPPDEKG